MLEMMYFCAELVHLIVNRSDSELEVQRYSMKKNTLIVDPIMLEDEQWMRQRENRPQTAEVGVLKTEPRKPSFRFLNFEVGSVFRKLVSNIFIGFCTPLLRVCVCVCVCSLCCENWVDSCMTLVCFNISYRWRWRRRWQWRETVLNSCKSYPACESYITLHFMGLILDL